MTTCLATILRNALGVVAVLLTVTTGRAATPSFDSFDTNDFRVVKTTAPWKILSNTANNTNSFTNVVINYINSTIINTNTIITNVNTTIVNTNTTIVNQGDTIINTNVTQVSNYTTNFIDNSVITITNTVINITNTVININGNTNGVGSLNPTIGRLPYKQDTNSFGDSSMYFIDTNTTGTTTLEVTDLANGGVVVSLLSGIVTNLSNGTGALTNDGAGNLGWTDISGANLWKVVGSTNLEPVDPTWQPIIVPGLYIGTNSMVNYGGFVLTNGEVVIASRDTSAGDVDFAQYVQEVSNGVGGKTSTQMINDHRLSEIIQESVVGGFSFSKFQTTVDDSGAELILYATNSTGVHLYPSAPWHSTNSVMPYTFDTVYPGTFSGVRLVDFKDSGTNVLSIGPQGELFFGLGFTNVLYRSGSDLVYTNSGTAPNLQVINGSGSVGYFGLSSSGSVQVKADTAKSVLLSVTGVSGSILFDGSELAPNNGAKDLGGSGTSDSWRDLWLNRNAYFEGFNDGAGSYSRLAVSHTGTNGVGDGIVFDSQASGAGGTPRDFNFELGGTNFVKFTRTNPQGRIVLNSPDGVTVTTIASDNSGVSSVGSTAAITLFGSGFNVNFQSGSMQPTSTMDLGNTPFPWHQLYLGSADVQIDYGSTNTAPSNPTTPVTWVKVTITGDTNTYRMPIYK